VSATARSKPATRAALEALLAMIAQARDFEEMQRSAREALARLDEMWEVETLDSWPVLPEEPVLPPESRDE
jgi:hypothetical protein